MNMTPENTQRWAEKGKNIIGAVGTLTDNQDAAEDAIFALMVWAQKYGFDFDRALSNASDSFRKIQ